MAFPSSPTNNQVATVNGIRYTYSSATNSWARISSGKTYTVSTVAPISPNIGDEWYNSSIDVLFEYINDGVNTVWVDIQSLGQTSNVSSIGNAIVYGNITVGLGNVYSIGTSSGYIKSIFVGNTVANTIYVNNGVFWGNGTTFSSDPSGVAIAMSIVFGGS